MATKGVSVQVYGLKEFRLSCMTLERRLPDVMDDAAKEAADVVAQGARTQIPLGPAIRGHLRDSVKTERKGDGWSVSAYGPNWPYGPLMDFGGTWNRHTGNPSHRAFFKKGRYIYPSYERNRARITRIMETALRRHAEMSGLDVT
jgi:hypothetical protein